MNDSTRVHVAPRELAEAMHPYKASRRLTLLSAAERRYCEPHGMARRQPTICARRGEWNVRGITMQHTSRINP